MNLHRFLLPVAALGLAGILSLSWPLQPDRSEPSRVLFDQEGGLLRIWLDNVGQYRFPGDGRYSNKYYLAATYFEDKRFAAHPGVDLVAVVRAIWQNLRAGQVVSGASTLSMQVARLRHPRPRTWWAKIQEAHTALRMEWQWGKQRIFAEYASRAPMGGNLVGAETACWRFFGHSPAEMTWAEATLLALLPNRPSAWNLERSREQLLQRRNTLLRRLAAAGHLDTLALKTALAEPLPRAIPWRFRAPHYSEAIARHSGQQRITGTLEPHVQEQLERLARLHGNNLATQHNTNISVLVMETTTGKIRGYLGSLDYFDTLSRGMVDGVLARRSTGSVLKPFLYGLALSRGPYTPETLLEDVPAWYNGFSPQNADRRYSGLVSLRAALARSLNVPAVNVLADLGVEEFHYWLRSAGLGGLFRSPEGYGLPLVLGGAEASLAELVPLYAMLLRDGQQTPLQWTATQKQTTADTLLSPGASYWVREMLTSVLRPDVDQYHAWFDRQVPVAWKTGTSYGSRDGWAIGANSQWTIGVWVGHFQGGGIPGLSGGSTAAPLLFSLFNVLTNRNQNMWPGKPAPIFFREREICTLTGYPAGSACPLRERIAIPAEQTHWQPCPYHRTVIVSAQSGLAVDSRCWNTSDTLHRQIAYWPAPVRAVWRSAGVEPPAPPAQDPACGKDDITLFSWQYPRPGTRIYLPRDNENAEAGFIARVTHSQKEITLYWFLDGVPLGQTTGEHQMTIRTSGGNHVLVVQDQTGRFQKTGFSVRRSDHGS